MAFDDAEIVEGVDEDCVRFFSEVVGSRDGVVEGHSDKPEVQPLATVVSGAVNFEFRGNFGHEDGPLDLELIAAVGYALGVVACAGCHHSSGLLFFSQVKESGAGASQLETSDVLQILPLDEDISLILL